MAGHLERLVLRLAVGMFLAALLFVVSVDRHVAAEAALGLAYMGVVVVASWRLPSLGLWATVSLAALAWAAAPLDFRDLGWPPDVSRVVWLRGVARLGALAALAATVTTFRRATRRLLRTEDTLALTLLQERDSARRDRLTRLWNSRYLYEALDQEIARCRRYGRPFGLLTMDLDGFKAVNDTGGHEAGDHVLQIVGRVLRENCRATDIPARLGGDEFAVILPEASSLTVPRYAAKLVALIGRAPFPPHLPRVTASVGAVAFARPPGSVKAALALADEAMYVAKREGKNRFGLRCVEDSP